MEANMNKKLFTWRDQIRISLAIGGKDILEALKNKTTLTVIISALFVVVAYRLLPTLSAGASNTNLMVYDASSSNLVEQLEQSPAFDIYTVSSRERFMQLVGEGDVPELGIVIPADFSLQPSGEENKVIEAYLLYWVTEADAQELVQLGQTEIQRLTGAAVSIEIQPERVYPQGIDNTRGLWAAMSLVFMSIMIGVSLLPHLILEEKQGHTLEALLVSPANSYQFVVGKALAGLFFIMTGAVIVLIVYNDIILHWWIAIIAALAVGIFAVSVGLWLGMRIENRGQLTMWAWIIIIPLFMPVLLYLLAVLFPSWLTQIARFIPTVTGLQLLLHAFSLKISLSSVLLQTGYILLCSTLVLLVIARMVRLFDHTQSTHKPGWSASLDRFIKSLIPERHTPQPDTESDLAEYRAKTQSYPTTGTPGWPQDNTHQFSGTVQTGLVSNLRVIWVIAAKDIRDAIRNKLFISILIGVTLMAGQSIILPLLLRGSDTPTAVVFSESQSSIINELAQQEGVRVRPVDSRQQMEEQITGSPQALLGLVIPAEFDQQIQEGVPVQLELYAAHWGDTEKVTNWGKAFEAKLGEIGATGVTVNTDWNRVYPAEGASGQPMIGVIIMVIGILTIGIVLVPILFVEEKEAHTLEVLLVSPARTWQVVVAKLLVGVFYGSIAAIALLLLNNYLIVNWGIAILAALSTILFAGAIGVLVGIISENPTTTGMWGSLIVLVVVATSFLRLFENVTLPPVIQVIVDWSPGSSMLNLFSAAMTRDVSTVPLYTSLALLLALGLVLYTISGIILNRKMR